MTSQYQYEDGLQYSNVNRRVKPYSLFMRWSDIGPGDWSWTSSLSVPNAAIYQQIFTRILLFLVGVGLSKTPCTPKWKFITTYGMTLTCFSPHYERMFWVIYGFRQALSPEPFHLTDLLSVFTGYLAYSIPLLDTLLIHSNIGRKPRTWT